MNQKRPGFTLVELLVVITIIGILMGLLIPAVNSARETARRNQCSTQIKNLALAAIQYENTKGHLPYWVNKYGYFAGGADPSDLNNDFGGSGVPAHVKVGGFGVSLLPWLDAQPTYEHWTEDRYPVIHDGSGDQEASSGLSGDGFHSLAAPNLAIMQCPSSPVTEGSHGKNNYIPNNGMSQYRTQSGHTAAPTVSTGLFAIVATTLDSQTKANTCFTAGYRGLDSGGTLLATASPVKLDDLKDGQGNTCLFSENVQAAPWHRPGFLDGYTGSASPLAPTTGTEDITVSTALTYGRFTNGMVWHYEDPQATQLNALGTPPTSPTGAAIADVFQQHRINGGGNTVQEDIFNLTMDAQQFDAPSLARPSSAHTDGVNCGFADGGTRFVTEQVDYRVYQAIMTPRGKSSDVPWQEYVLDPEAF